LCRRRGAGEGRGTGARMASGAHARAVMAGMLNIARPCGAVCWQKTRQTRKRQER